MTAARVVQVGVISDTHLDGPWDHEPFRALFAGPFARVALVIHAGDVGDADSLLYEALDGVRVQAVGGNCDVADDPRLPPQRIVTFENYRIGVIHGWGDDSGTPRRAANAFAGANIDAVVFGHTHRPYLATVGPVTYFNPGSMLWPRGEFATVGRLTLTDGRPTWEHFCWQSTGGGLWTACTHRGASTT